MELKELKEFKIQGSAKAFPIKHLTKPNYMNDLDNHLTTKI